MDRRPAISLYIDGSVRAEWERVELRLAVRTAVQAIQATCAERSGGVRLRMAYWSCGPRSDQVEPIGEVEWASESEGHLYGPREKGGSLRLLPGLRHYIDHVRGLREPPEAGCAVFFMAGRPEEVSELAPAWLDVAEKIALGVLPELRFVLVPLSDRCASYARATVADLNHRSGRRFWTCRALDELAFVDVLRTPIFDVETRAAILDEDGNALHQYDRPLSALWRPATTRICRGAA